MAFENSFKHSLKRLRWQARRAGAAMQWGSGALASTPVVFGNAMPKSGSHLINQVLQGLTRIGPFVNPRLPEKEILAGIQSMRPGDIAYGYILAKEPFLSALSAPGRATIFVYRDPRDMIISHIFYATEMHDEHWMHQYYTETLHTMEERINAAIEGVQEPGSELTPVRQRYAGYSGWLSQPEVLSMRFEDLILDRATAFNCLLDYLEQRGYVPKKDRRASVETLSQAIIPKKSGTFRKGKPGNWQDYFTEENKTFFKEKTGDLLIQLGYEKDDNW
jgi:hypothetical protein